MPLASRPRQVARGWPVAGEGCFVFRSGRVGPRAWLCNESCSGRGLRANELAHPACCSGLDGGLFALRAPFHRQKEAGRFRSPPRRERWPCWPWCAAAGGAGSSRMGRMQRIFVIRPAGAPAWAGSKAKRSGLAASGQGVTWQRKLWRARPAGWRAGSSGLWPGPRWRLAGLAGSVPPPKRSRMVSSTTPQRALALLAVARRGGRGWKQRGGIPGSVGLPGLVCCGRVASAGSGVGSAAGWRIRLGSEGGDGSGRPSRSSSFASLEALRETKTEAGRFRRPAKK